MQKLLIKYLSVLILVSALFCSKYQNLILIEFDNVERNRHFDYLRTSLPNKIKNYPFFSTNFNIEYAGSIEPYLDSNNIEILESALLMGKFFISNSQIKVSYNIYDMNNWEKIITKEFYCLSRDEDCINSSLLTSLNNSFASLFSISDTHIDSAYIIKSDPIVYSDDNSQYVFDNIYGALENFAIEADLQHSWKELTKHGNQFGNRYYKDIDSLDHQYIIDNSKKSNTDKLLGFIDKILINPYNVVIDEISFDEYLGNTDNISITIPVKYSIKKDLIEDFLITLPHTNKSNKNGSVSISFSRDDFIFTNEIEDRFALMNYQVLPVLFLTDSDGKLSRVHIDSWKHSNKVDNINNEEISITDSFYPLFAITPGEKNLYVHLDMQVLQIDYNFIVSSDEIDNISKVAIKFLYESEIEKAINDMMVNDD